jgi:hypothetical protein
MLLVQHSLYDDSGADDGLTEITKHRGQLALSQDIRGQLSSDDVCGPNPRECGSIAVLATPGAGGTSWDSSRADRMAGSLTVGHIAAIIRRGSGAAGA